MYRNGLIILLSTFALLTACTSATEEDDVDANRGAQKVSDGEKRGAARDAGSDALNPTKGSTTDASVGVPDAAAEAAVDAGPGDDPAECVEAADCPAWAAKTGYPAPTCASATWSCDKGMCSYSYFADECE